MTSQPGEQQLQTHIVQYSYIRRSKGNHAMKFGQLVKCGEENIPRPFSKKSKLIRLYLWINSLKFYAICFYCMLS